MTDTTRTKPIVRSRVEAALAALGFRHRGTAWIYTSDLSGTDVLGWIGLNRSTRRGDGVTAINPNVGVRHQAVERLVAALSNRPFDAYAPPTIFTPIGYLTPHRTYREWIVRGSDAVDGTVADMVDAIKRYGITFMEANVDLRQIVARLREGKYGYLQDIDYRLPAALLLLGDIVAARVAVEAALHRRESTHLRAEREYQVFADNLHDYVEKMDRVDGASDPVDLRHAKRTLPL